MTKTPLLGFILSILILLFFNLLDLFDFLLSNNSNFYLTFSTILSVHCPKELVNLELTSDMTPSQKHRLKKKILEWGTVSDCKDIVVYGSNLEFSQSNSKQLQKHVYYMYGLPSIQLEIIIGLILSDAWLNIDKNNRAVNAKLGFKQSTVNFASFWSVFWKLSHYCNSLPYLNKTIKNGKLFYSLAFQTRSLPVLTILHNQFYNNGIKIVPVDIKKYLTPISLAYWIQGDGYKRNKGVALCTDSFTKVEIKLLIDALNENFGFNCTSFLQAKDQYRIHINLKNMPLLRSIVAPHMHPSMLYKLGL